LELDGVLKSWAVPLGPSLDPAVKRLAVSVEDHPLDYQDFEGNIPEGEYGAGEVIIWDKGDYQPDDKGEVISGDLKSLEAGLKEGLEKGKISFTLNGRKLKGSFALVRLQKSPKNWLLIKHSDQYASKSIDVLKEDSSVASGRTIEELKKKPNRPNPPRSK
jgi:bifunctional non-homologous end joining protein LigD